MEAATAVVVFCLCLGIPQLVGACGHDTITDLVQQHVETHQKHLLLLRALNQRLPGALGNGQGLQNVQHTSSVHPDIATTSEKHLAAARKQPHRHEMTRFRADQDWMPHLLSHWQADIARSSSVHARHLQDNSTQPSAALAPGPVRIHVEFQHEELVPSHASDTLQSITNTMVQVLGSFLSVRAPREGALLVPPRCQLPDLSTGNCSAYYPSFAAASNQLLAGYGKCGNSVINPAHILDPLSCTSSSSASCTSMAGIHSGELADIYLYVTTVADTQCNSGAAAWALPCLFDPVTGRPLLANANVCPDALARTDPDVMVAVMVHEVIHALGFTSSLFPSFIDPNTNQQLPRSSVLKTSSVGAQSVTRVITPTVVREVRAQFGCPDLEGAQLEDEGGGGSANSHWEYSHYQGELMLASTMFSAAGEPPRLSRITLALLEDSGWYLGNWSMVGGPLQWGYNTGCVLPSQGCHQFIATQPDVARPMFCNAVADSALGNKLRFRSTASYRAVGQCSNVQFGNNCSMVVARGAEPSCADATYQYVNPEVFGWYHGESSRAYSVQYKFTAGLSDGSNGLLTYPANGNDGDRDAACYPSSCSADGQLYMSIGGRDIRCPAGQYVDLAVQLPGTFQQGIVGPCPDEADVCATLGCAACHPKGGMCFMGACMCKVGWSGSDCSFSMRLNATMPVVISIPADNANQGPMTINVTHWYQLIEITMDVINVTLLQFEDRWNGFTQVVASWAQVAAEQVTLNSTMVGAEMPPSPVSGDANSPQTGTPVAQQRSMLAAGQYTAVAAQQPGSNRQSGRTAVGQHRLAKANTVTALHGSLRHLSSLFRHLLDTVAAQHLRVVCGIRSASTDQTTQLMGMLQSTQQRVALASALQAAGFHVDTPSLQISLRLTSEVVVDTLDNAAANKATTRAVEDASSDLKSNKLFGSSTITICIAVGGAVLLLSAIVVISANIRKASIKNRRSAVKAQKVAQGMHEQAAIAAAATAAASAPPLPAIKSPKQELSSSEAAAWTSNQVFGPQAPESPAIAAVPAPGQVFISVSRNPVFGSSLPHNNNSSSQPL